MSDAMARSGGRNAVEYTPIDAILDAAEEWLICNGIKISEDDHAEAPHVATDLTNSTGTRHQSRQMAIYVACDKVLRRHGDEAIKAESELYREAQAAEPDSERIEAKLDALRDAHQTRFNSRNRGIAGIVREVAAGS